MPACKARERRIYAADEVFAGFGRQYLVQKIS